MARYRAELERLLIEHKDQLLREAKRAYHAAPPAMDAKLTPSEVMAKRLKKIQGKITEEFNRRAEIIATRYMKRTFKWTEKKLKKNLLEAGMPTVEYQDSEARKDLLSASISENVSLIKSIPQQFHTKVEGMVMRAFTQGSSWGDLFNSLRDAFRVTTRRAKLISGDQISKATGNCVRLRQMELGIKRAKWLHSGGGKKPRPDHVKANGKIYEVEKGCKISGEYIIPGQLINCRCTCRAIIE